jgi:hypothetical protein
MRLGLSITFLSTGMAWLVSCAGQVSEPHGMVGSGGSVSGTGASTNSGGSGAGDGFIDLTPMSDLTNDCELAAGTTEYSRSNARWQCFALESFSVADSSDTLPHFPAGGAGGLGGAASTSCPRASELDWSCRVSEGHCCSSPQCEAPEAAIASDGQCCYVVSRTCGV